MMYLSASESDETFSQIDDSLMPLIEDFGFQAAARGLKIDVFSMNLNIQIVEIEEYRVIGRCSFFVSGRRITQLNQEIWTRIDELTKEYMLFHELGRCVLHKDHLDITNDRERRLSLMYTGLDFCVLGTIC